MVEERGARDQLETEAGQASGTLLAQESTHELGKSESEQTALRIC